MAQYKYANGGAGGGGFVLPRGLEVEMAYVTEVAAIAAGRLRGRGDKMGADKAAVDAMRDALSRVAMTGTVVIGEGEMDEAPMLFIGEELGAGGGPEVDIAVDPLEGTTICAKAMPNALAVLAIAERGGLLHAPDMYMDKIAIGPGYPDGIIDLDASPADNLNALAKEQGVSVSEITACILERDRHAGLIKAVRDAGAGIQLISDGDIAGVFWTTEPEDTGVDIYMGSGGAPEGVLAAAALRCTGGQIQGRLLPADDKERARAQAMGIANVDGKLTLGDMVSKDVIFSATGVTSGSMLTGVHYDDETVETETLVMHAGTQSIRRITTLHALDVT